MAAINPYINFDGKCEEAFNFYRTVFGGEFTSFQRFKDMPADSGVPENEGDYVMHVELPIGNGTTLMGSDRPSGMGKTAVGDNVQISIQSESDEETDRLWSGLTKGGQITMPLEQTFWGARFGMFVDRYGIQWMINQATDQSS